MADAQVSLPKCTVSDLELSPAGRKGAVVCRQSRTERRVKSAEMHKLNVPGTHRKELGMGVRVHLNVICISLSGR